jgi:hypothetical protein
MPRFSVEDRFSEAYVRMAEQANYHPEFTGADGDLGAEAASYAKRFVAEERTGAYHIGVTDTSNRALAFTVVAAKKLCGGVLGVEAGLELLEMAVVKVKAQSSGLETVGGDLQDGAASRAERFVVDGQTGSCYIGTSDYTSNRALVFTIEAAKQLCRGASGIELALKLLEMAVVEVRVQLPNYPELPNDLRGARLG